ncbi:nicotinate (nicotinamide) nucleotide adenylyltransferase [Luteolibacter luteus]|uniref:Probable nicotinate-nucleotide adenylyltransferase n=1 Tax=Luteolibacter luteus TaxID=2728835 RepID=A0A858RE83_9BACT|nr:nicotinate (nicotinamide) nucleotide adenylyltransferase [Luteolibacter luteus]QJE95052.1 nicotinate (nicotinamide) nucleotide adenylyltransferase [Luteolibacter luteus]
MSMDSARRIALFGGTFDPIHEGHLEIAQRAKDALALDEVRFLPCHTSPHKLGVLSAPPEDRLEMVRLAIADLPWAVADDHDLTCPQPAYSFLTAEEMARRYPGSRLFWLMGADQWRALPRWKEPERLAKAVEFIVFARDGRPEAHLGWRMHFVPGTHPASATALRGMIAGGKAPLWLPPAVADYIARKGLYKP